MRAVEGAPGGPHARTQYTEHMLFGRGRRANASAGGKKAYLKGLGKLRRSSSAWGPCVGGQCVEGHASCGAACELCGRGGAGCGRGVYVNIKLGARCGRGGLGAALTRFTAHAHAFSPWAHVKGPEGRGYGCGRAGGAGKGQAQGWPGPWGQQTLKTAPRVATGWAGLESHTGCVGGGWQQALRQVVEPAAGHFRD